MQKGSCCEDGRYGGAGSSRIWYLYGVLRASSGRYKIPLVHHPSKHQFEILEPVVISKGYDFRLPNDELASRVVEVSVGHTSFVSREGVDKRLQKVRELTLVSRSITYWNHFPLVTLDSARYHSSSTVNFTAKNP